MKNLKKIVFLAAISICSTSVFAEKSKVFKAVNDDVATKVCAAAANSGISAAKAVASKNGMRFDVFKAEYNCNGVPAWRFVARYGR